MQFETNALGGWIVPAGSYLPVGTVIPAHSELGAGCWLGPECVLGASCTLGPDCVLGADCVIGEDCVLGAGCELGPRCLLGAGCEITGVESEPGLPERVAQHIEEHPEQHDQREWHSECGTRHCVAGLTVLLSRQGLDLEARYGTDPAARMLLSACGVSGVSFSPDARTEDILQDLRCGEA